jgi:CheY-like chemotaxis protein
MAQLSHLLLFDPDPSGLETLTFGFQREGYSVTGTGDPAKARSLLQGASHSLILVNLRDDGRAGLDLIRGMTTNPRTRNLACMGIGRAELRGQALAAGAFGYLTTPLFVLDVLGACRLAGAAMVPGSRPSPETEISLKLADLHGLYCLIRALAGAGRSTVIELRRGKHRGELRFIDGVLTSASLGPLSGFAALHPLLLWEDAELRFKFRHVVHRGTHLAMKSRDLLDECERFLRDFSHEVKDLAVARTVYTPDPARAEAAINLQREIVPVLRLFDSRRTFAEVIEESPFRIFDTLRIVKRLVEAQVIGVTQAPPVRAEDDGGNRLSLDAWFQRPAPSLGAEVGRRSEPAAAGRASSPFVAVVVPAAGADKAGDRAEPGERKKTITQRHHTLEPAAPAKPAPAVARGEITAKPAAAARLTGTVPSVNAPSVLVDSGAVLVPAATAPLSVIAGPLAAAPAAAAPSVIVAPPAAAPAAALPSVIVAPPAAAASPTVPGGGSPAPAARPSAAHPSPSVSPSSPSSPSSPPSSPTPPAGAKPNDAHPPARRRTPTPIPFNALESDFFAREADLYKREKVDSFDDLESAPRPGSNGRPGPARKR